MAQWLSYHRGTSVASAVSFISVGVLKQDRRHTWRVVVEQQVALEATEASTACKRHECREQAGQR